MSHIQVLGWEIELQFRNRLKNLYCAADRKLLVRSVFEDTFRTEVKILYIRVYNVMYIFCRKLDA